MRLLDAVTNHPVHIVDEEENISPSSLIPFCDIGGNMSVLGRQLEQFSLPVCTSFKRIIFNDQLCYQVNVTQYQDRVEKSQVYEAGLSFVVDTNRDRQYSDLQVLTPEDTRQSLGNKKAWSCILFIFHLIVNNYVKFTDSGNFLVYIGLLGNFCKVKTIKRTSLVFQLREECTEKGTLL